MYTLEVEQFIPASRDLLWDFISSPRNLKIITPETMGFEILSPKLPGKIYPGMMIHYHVKPLPWLRTKWVTEITQVQEQHYFVDEQRQGPYKVWHHEHILQDAPGGVVMKDIVNYLPPLGILGRIANAMFIEKRLNDIFRYREIKLSKIFGKPE